MSYDAGTEGDIVVIALTVEHRQEVWMRRRIIERDFIGRGTETFPFNASMKGIQAIGRERLPLPAEILRV